VHTYSVVLYVHLLGLLLAVGATALAFHGALRLRDATDADEVARWARFVAAVVPCFPVATLLLAGSGAYLTQVGWSWTTAWIDAGIAGLALIAVCGSAIEGPRTRALAREARTAGMTPRARALQRDPLSWSAKLTTLTLALAVTFLMVTKPSALGSALALVVAVLVGPLGAVPLWRSPARAEQPVAERPLAASAPAPRAER
jgi:uncharacterized membrane protein